MLQAYFNFNSWNSLIPLDLATATATATATDRVLIPTVLASLSFALSCAAFWAAVIASSNLYR